MTTLLTKAYVKATIALRSMREEQSGEQTMTTVVIMVIFVLAIAAFGIKPIREFLVGAPGEEGGGLFGQILAFFQEQAGGIGG